MKTLRGTLHGLISFLVLLGILVVFVRCDNSGKTERTLKEKAREKKHPIDPYNPDNNPPAIENNSYRLVFNDEFNHEGPMKEEFWNSETGFCIMRINGTNLKMVFVRVVD